MLKFLYIIYFDESSIMKFTRLKKINFLKKILMTEIQENFYSQNTLSNAFQGRFQNIGYRYMLVSYKIKAKTSLIRSTRYDILDHLKRSTKQILMRLAKLIFLA